MSKRFYLIILIAYTSLISCSQKPYQQKREIALSEPFPAPKTETLFTSYEPVRILLSARFKTLFKSKTLEPDKFKENAQVGTLTIGSDSFPVSIQVKGHSTAIMCPFPKLEIRILGGLHKDSIFADAETFDFHTHCADESHQMDAAFKSSFYNHREAALYKILDILKIPTYRARPAYVQYNDEEDENSIDPALFYQAYFLEDLSSFKKRLQAEEIKGVEDPRRKPNDPTFAFKNLQEARQVDPEDAARIGLFNEMIGNYDWFIKVDSKHMRSEFDKNNLWNVKILEMPNKKWILFPYDLSLAGAVTGTNSASTYFRVWENISSASQNKIKKSFLENKSLIYEIAGTLDPIGKKYLEAKLNKFYSKIDQ